MRRKYDLSSEWNTGIRHKEYMMLFELDRKINRGDTLQLRTCYGAMGEYTVTNIYNARIVDIIDKDIVFNWYFANLVEYALQYDSEIPDHKKLDSQMNHEEWNKKLKKSLGTCILNHYGEPKERIVKVVTFGESVYYEDGIFADWDEPNWKRVKKLL